MTRDELERFLKQQASMSARIARKTARAKVIAAAYANMPEPNARSLGSTILNSLSRPGVAPTQRPKSATGAQTFHFKVTTVNRTSDFLTKLKGSKKGASAAHEGYIEREGAAERLHPEFARTSAEMHEEVWEALGGQAYIERPGAAEPIDGRSLASFGNIAEKFEDRLAFWEAMEAAASKPTSNGIKTQRGNDPDFWARVDRDPDAPTILRNAPPFIPLPIDEAQGGDPALNKPKDTQIPRYKDRQASEVLDYVRKHRSRTKAARDAPAVEIDPGRGGRIQTRIIVELPHELTPEQRLKIAQDFCHKKFVEGRETPLPHWCVIHAPDYHNDPRNTHMHIVFAERPAKRMIHPESGQECWDFEVQIKVRDENKHNRLCRPFEQKTDRTLTKIKWVVDARKDYAAIANAALAAAGKAKVYDARTYKAMGIEEKPRERINGKDYIKEKKGETTEAGTPSITAQWEREEARLGKRHNRFGASAKVMGEFDAELKRWHCTGNPVWGHLLVHQHEYAVAMAFVTALKADRAANAFVLAKMQSKILPPLQSRDEDALMAQDFLRMYRNDVVKKGDRGIDIQRRNAKRALSALRKAQAADPRKTTDANFLTGRPAFSIPMPITFHETPEGNLDPIKTFENWRQAVVPEVDEGRQMRAALAEQVAARRGEPVPEHLATQMNAPEPSAAPSPIPAPTGPVSTPSGPLSPAATGKDAGTSAAGQQPPKPTFDTTPRSRLDVKVYAEALRTLGVRTKPTIPAIEALTRTVPPEMRKYGDEIGLPFLSETGRPIQHRVFSGTRIRTADEQAAAVAATIERRRAERAAKRDAEVAAMRADPAKARAGAEQDAQRAAARHAASAPSRDDPSKPAQPTAAPPQTPPKAAPQQTATGPTSPKPEPAKPVFGTRPANAHAMGEGAPADRADPSRARTDPAVTSTTTTAPVFPPARGTGSDPERTEVRPSAPQASKDVEPNNAAPQPNLTTKTDPPPAEEVPAAAYTKKKRVSSAEELRRRALMAAMSRGRGR